MKILVFKWKVYHQETIIHTLRNMGHTVYEEDFGDRSYNDDEAAVKDIIGIVQRWRPDIVFTVNYFGVISDACMDCMVRYVSWTCDSPLIAMYHQSVFNSCNYIFIFDKVQYYYFRQMGLEHVYYLPLAAQAKALDTLAGEEFAAPVSFVGSLYAKNSYDGITGKLTPYLRGYFDASMNAQADIFGENLFDRLLTPEILKELSQVMDFRQSERSFSDIGLVFNTTFLGFKMAQIERIGCLSRLGMEHEVKLYTDSAVPVPNVHNMGSVSYCTDMPKVFYQSDINLNLTIRNIRSGIPLRVWDILGSGGFLLTNYQAEFEYYFGNGRDLVWFESVDDMCRKADYYLKNDAQRKTIARNGYELVRKKHSYECRLRQILKTITQ